MDEIFFHITVNAQRQRQGLWGDTAYAEALSRHLTRIEGCGADISFRGEAPEQRPGRNVVLRIAGPHIEEPVPGLLNLLWMITKPSIVNGSMLARFQTVFCASMTLTQRLLSLGVTAEYLAQATDPEHFRPDRHQDTPLYPVSFVGALSPRAERRIIRAVAEAGLDLHIWGPGWKGAVPDEMLRGERLDYDELAEVYAASRIVLNSHMPDMIMAGMMSNRSFDALASGAIVVSDRVRGFAAEELRDLIQIDNPHHAAEALQQILDQPHSWQDRLDRHRQTAAQFSFETRARLIVARARALLEQDRRTMPVFALGPVAAAPLTPLALSDPARSAAEVLPAMQSAAAEMVQIAGQMRHCLPDSFLPPTTVDRADEGVIHPLMADLREMQGIALAGPRRIEAEVQRINRLAAKARRMIETAEHNLAELQLALPPRIFDHQIIKAVLNEPAWESTPESFHREGLKSHLKLWPRKVKANPMRPVGVFLHLFHPDLAEVFARRLRNLQSNYSLYVSTDTQDKANFLRGVLPKAQIRVVENRGRDIWPKFFALGAAHADHDVVLHLHGKKSGHSDRLGSWLDHILDTLLGSVEDVNRILSLFQSVPQLGLLYPVAYRAIMGAAHWGTNFDTARELAFRMKLGGSLPDDGALRFPAGSMFWARTDALRPLLDLRLRPAHFPPELAQTDGTTAHAIERLIGIVARDRGYHAVAAVGSGQKLHGKYGRQFTTNREVRLALEAGERLD